MKAIHYSLILASLLGLFTVYRAASTLWTALPRVRNAVRLDTPQLQFCSAIDELSELDKRNSIIKVLFAGAPPYWGVPPIPNLMHFAKSGLDASDSGLVTEYTAFQTYAHEMSEDAIMLDIGANYGFTTLPVAATGRTVYAFEPVPYAQRYFRLAVCFNRFWDRVHLINAAVGARDTEATIYVPGEFADNSAMAAAVSEANTNRRGTGIRVPVLTLDTFAARLTAAEIKRIALVKIDVQGEEGNVIKGGQKLLSSLQSGTWVVAEHDDRLIKPFIAAGNRAGLWDDLEGMVRAGYTVHETRNGQEVTESRWRVEAPPDNDWWYKKV